MTTEVLLVPRCRMRGFLPLGTRHLHGVVVLHRDNFTFLPHQIDGNIRVHFRGCFSCVFLYFLSLPLVFPFLLLSFLPFFIFFVLFPYCRLSHSLNSERCIVNFRSALFWTSCKPIALSAIYLEKQQSGRGGVFDIKRRCRYEVSYSYRPLLMNNVSSEICVMLYYITAIRFFVEFFSSYLQVFSAYCTYLINCISVCFVSRFCKSFSSLLNSHLLTWNKVHIRLVYITL
jgi:hypothetical protein